jgi:hypothetical protein
VFLKKLFLLELHEGFFFLSLYWVLSVYTVKNLVVSLGQISGGLGRCEIKFAIGSGN